MAAHFMSQFELLSFYGLLSYLIKLFFKFSMNISSFLLFFGGKSFFSLLCGLQFFKQTWKVTLDYDDYFMIILMVKFMNNFVCDLFGCLFD